MDLIDYCNNIKQIDKWPTHKIINTEIDKVGKHIIKFDKDFPCIIRGYRIDLNYPLTPNYHDYLEIGYIFDGKICIKVNKNKYNLDMGDFIMIGNNQFHTFEVKGKSKSHYLAIHFLPEFIFTPGGNNLDFEYIRSFYDKCQIIGNIIPKERISEKLLLDIFSEIFKQMRLSSLVAKLKVKVLLKTLLIEFVKYYENFSAKKYNQNIKRIYEIERLMEVFKLLQSKYYSDITLDEVAKVACMNKFYFSKYFHKVTGNTFFKYLSRIRIDKAKELLLKDKTNISKIAFSVGFNNLCSFYKKFKQLTNCTPEEFRMNI